MKRKELHIALLWHSSTSGNLGIGALTLGNISLIKAAADRAGVQLRLSTFEMVDGDCPSIVDPQVTVRTLNMRRLLLPSGLNHWLRDVDLVLDIGAGDSFAEIYGPKRFFMLAYSKWLVIYHKVPLILSPQTVGPFLRSPYKQVAGWLMDRAVAVIARDAVSRTVAKNLAPRGNIIEAADVAFVLPFTDRSAERGDIRGGKARIGVNVSGLLHYASVNGQNPFGLEIDYADYVTKLLTRLTSRNDIEVHLITHAISRGMADDDDNVVADRFSTLFPTAIRVPSFTHPSLAKSYISSLDLLIASRMHACIGAYSSGVPVLPVAYSRKFKGVFGKLGYNWEVPVTGMNTSAAVDYTLRAIESRQEMSKSIETGSVFLKELIEPYEMFLEKEFRRLLSTR